MQFRTPKVVGEELPLTKDNDGISRQSSDSHPGQTRCTRNFLAALILLFGSSAGAVILGIGINSAHEESQVTFERHASELATTIASSWHDYETYALWIQESCHLLHDQPTVPVQKDVAAHFGFCSREQFLDLATHISSLGVGFVAMQFLPNVTHDARQYIEEEARDYYSVHNQKVAKNYIGIKSSNVSTPANVDDFIESPKKPFYFPIHYMHPLENNEDGVEIDTYSYQKELIDKAIVSGQPVMSQRTRIFQDPRPEVYAVKIVHPGLPGTRRDDSLQNAVSVIVVRVFDLILTSSQYYFGGLCVLIYDVTPSVLESEGNPVFLGGADIVSKRDLVLKNETDLKSLKQDSLFFTQNFDILDHTWMILIKPISNDSYQPDLEFVILFGSIILIASVLLTVWFRIHLSHVARKNRLKSEIEREKAEDALKRVQRERYLNDFIAHEVRNPLSSAIAALNFATELTKEQIDDKDVQNGLLEDLNIVDNSLNYINDLLRNMLDIHRTKNKDFKLKCEATNILKDILEPSISILRVRGKKNRVNFEVECFPPEIIASVDRLRVQQILLNLALNSTKFVEAGFIRLRAEVVLGMVRLSVEDSGPGIPLQKRDQLFVKYQESLDELNQGTGVGLYICKNLSELMKADITLDETYHSGLPDKPGARFIIDLNQPAVRLDRFGPRRPSCQTQLVASAEQPLQTSDLKFLDEEPSEGPSSSETTGVFVGGEISNGSKQNLESINSSTEDASLDQREDGWEKDKEDDVSQDVPRNVQLYQQAGKSQEARVQLTGEVVGGEFLPKTFKVLFTDDDAVLRKLFARSLHRVAPDWILEQAPNGEKALDMVSSPNGQYDLIFMDMYMSSTERRMLGTEAVKQMRERGITCIICGLSANDTEREFIDAGADAFLLKPFPCQIDPLRLQLIRIFNAAGSGSCQQLWGGEDY